MDFVASLTEPWAYVLVGLLAVAESAAFVGLLAPGEATLIMGGVLVAQGRADLSWMLVAATLGAVLGDSISYELGRRIGPRLPETRVGRRIGPHRWERAGGYLLRRGGTAVFVARFIGVLRPLVPVAAGAAGMPYRTFLAANVSGGALWATGSVMIGVAAGKSLPAVKAWLHRASLGIGLAIAFGLFLTLVVRWARRHPEEAWSVLARLAYGPWPLPVPISRRSHRVNQHAPRTPTKSE